jgi:hypothetical protein
MYCDYALPKLADWQTKKKKREKRRGDEGITWLAELRWDDGGAAATCAYHLSS